MNLKRALARAMLSGMFIRGGYHAAMEPGERVALTEKSGLPKPEVMVRLNGTLMVLGGILLALGIKEKHAALLLAACLIPTTYVGHNFWDEESDQARDLQLTQFMKNVAMLGGLLAIVADDRRSAA
jgi:putative oxidoreductase